MVARHHDVARADVTMQEALVVQILDGVGHLREITNAMAIELLAAVFDQIVETHPFDQFHHKVWVTFLGQTMLEGLDDVLVMQQHADRPLARLFDAGEACFELLGFDAIEQFQANDAAEIPIAGAPDLGHASLARSVQQVKALGDIDTLLLLLAAGPAEQVAEEAHGLLSGRLDLCFRRCDLIITIIDDSSHFGAQVLAMHDAIDKAMLQ